MRTVFVAGGTGYMGSRLIAQLLSRGHSVRALARAESQQKLPQRCTVITGNALDCCTYRGNVGPADTFVHLVGVAHPSPSKAAQFRTIDLVAAREAIQAAKMSAVAHFVYVSVAQPAPVMKAY